MQVRLPKWISVLSRVQIPHTISSNVSAKHPFGFSLLSLFSSEAIAGALIQCRQTQTPGNGGAFHALTIKHGLCHDVYIANNLISMYGYLYFFDYAVKLFEEMPQRNAVSWTALISSYSHAGNLAEVLRIFVQMVDGGSEMPNCHTLSTVLKACAMTGDIEMGKWVHHHIQKFQLQPDTALINAVIDMYLKCDDLVEARNTFDSNFPLNLISWNTMISGYCNAGEMIEAENLFCQIPIPDAVSFNIMILGFAKKQNPKASLHYVRFMHKQGFKLDHFTLPCALKTCGSLGESGMGRQLHGYIIRCGCEGGLFCMGPSLINMYGNCGHVNSAVMLFDEFEECLNYKWSDVDRLPHFNSMLAAFAYNGFYKCTLHLFSKINVSKDKLDAFSLSSALKACINSNNMRIGLQVHGLIVINGYHINHVVGSMLVELYAKCGKLEDALKVFSRVPRKDLILWTGLMTSCVQKGLHHFALVVFRDMTRLQCNADHFVVSIALNACATLSYLHSGEQLHVSCIKNGFEMESVIITSLIDLYSKCGLIDNALSLFDESTSRDAVCWTGIIVGCGNNGRTGEAIELYYRMLESGEKPNEITFLSILSACRHAGLVDKACCFFETMEQKHGLKPSLEHYCCMVDILGRAGLFNEAMCLISGMPFEPDEKIWNSLVGASVMHQNVDMGRLALNHLHMIHRTDVSGIFSLSNVYAVHNLCGCSADMRELARNMSIKEAGRSWTEALN